MDPTMNGVSQLNTAPTFSVSPGPFPLLQLSSDKLLSLLRGFIGPCVRERDPFFFPLDPTSQISLEGLIIRFNDVGRVCVWLDLREKGDKARIFWSPREGVLRTTTREAEEGRRQR